MEQRQKVAFAVHFGPLTEFEFFRNELRLRETSIAEQKNEVERLKAEVSALKRQVRRFSNIIDADDGQLYFYTGLTKEYWQVLWDDLKLSQENRLSQKVAFKENSGRVNMPGAGRKHRLSLEDEMLMTLVRLRLGRLEEDLPYEFDVSMSTVCRIFDKWINFGHLKLGDFPIWPTKD